MNNFETRIAAALGQFQRGTVFLAAVSGGADSTAMLAGLAALRKEAGFVLHCVHVEHGLRPAGESMGDAKAVEALCEKLEVPCRVVSVPRGKIAACASGGGPGIEGAARFFRHRAWNREAGRLGAERILTAHTRDDLLETLLMRVLRGAGPAGLSPMPRSRGRLFRPLLDLTRRDVLEYLKEKNIPYRTDSTNRDIKFLRNRVRHKLVPLLDEFFPSWRNSVLALAETQSLAAEFLAAETRKRLAWESAGAEKYPSLRLGEKDFLEAPLILREEALFAAADMLAARIPVNTEKKIREIPVVPRRAAVRRAARLEAASPEDLGPVRLKRRNGYVEVAPARQTGGERGFSLLIKEAGLYILKGRVLGLGQGRNLRLWAGISRDEESRPREAVFFPAKFPLVLHNHRGPDCIFRAGHRRRFSDILDKDARSEYTGIVTARDTDGIAAFIGIGRDGDLMVIPREAGGTASPGNAADFFFVEVLLDNPNFGGINV